MADRPSEPAPETVETHVTAMDARQAITPHVTRYILAYGLAGAIVVLLITYLAFFWR